MSYLVITVVNIFTIFSLSSSKGSVHSDASAPTVGAFKCPDQFGYYADHLNCSKYFVCVFGEPLHESCTGGLHFSSELQTCDWPRNVECAAATDAEKSDSENSHHTDSLYGYNVDEISSIVDNQNDDSGGGETGKGRNSDHNDGQNGNKNGNEDYGLDLQRSRSVINNSQERNFGTIGRSISGTHHQNPAQYGPPNIDRGAAISEISADPNQSSSAETAANSDPQNGEPPKNNRLSGDDLNSPNFEEAIAAIVDENGGVHLHDGPGTLFSLVSASGDESATGDRSAESVFVKPITAAELRNLKSEQIRRRLSAAPVLALNRSLANQFPANTRNNNRLTQSPSQTQSQPQSPLKSSYQRHLPDYFGQPFNVPQDQLRVNQPRTPRQRIHIIINHNSNRSLTPDESIDDEHDFKRITATSPATSQRYSLQRSIVENRRPAQQIITTTAYNSRTTTTTASPRITTERRVATDNSYLTGNERRVASGNSRSVRPDYNQPELIRPAIVPIRQSTTPQRPPPVYHTPEPFSNAVKCNEQTCRLPDCYCGGTDIPGGLTVSQVPQIVLITFDDAVNDINWHIYEEIFNTGRKNPNGCPIRGTFYVSHEWTDYGQVQTLYSQGHEMASHSITHSFGERFSKSQWLKEINGQREILHLYGGVNLADIRGMRAPFLQGGGNKQFEMLYEANFTYDSSMPVFENSPPFWPYTLDYAINHDCMINPCPTKSFPGLWEIGMVMWQDLRGGRCSMGDACSNPSDENGVYEMIMKNFNRHYKSNRAPFGLYYHSAWFNSDHHKRGFIRVIDEILQRKDVYFLTKWQLIQWMREPTPLQDLHQFQPWQCPQHDFRAAHCPQPTVCNVGSKSGSRFFKTCQSCPAAYPWVGNTGFGKS